VWVADEPLPFAAALRSNGEIVFIESSKRLPFVASPDGTIRTLLRQGGGPGEVAGVIAVATGPAGQVALLDGVQRRLHVVNDRDSSILDLALDIGSPLAMSWPDDASRVWIRAARPGEAASSTLYRVDLETATVVARASVRVRALTDDDGERLAMCLQCPSTVSSDSFPVGVRGDSTYLVIEFGKDGAHRSLWGDSSYPTGRITQFDEDSAARSRNRMVTQFSKFQGFDPSTVPLGPKVGDPKLRFKQFAIGFDEVGALWASPTASTGDSVALHHFGAPGVRPSEWKVAPESRLFHVRGAQLLLGVADDLGLTFTVMRVRYDE
jgi:hypothetical protein